MKNYIQKIRSTSKSKKLKFGEKRVNAKVTSKKLALQEVSYSEDSVIGWDIMCGRMYDVDK